LNQNRALIFCFDAFPSRESVSTPHQVGGRLSLENALEKRQPEKPEAGAIFTHRLFAACHHRRKRMGTPLKPRPVPVRVQNSRVSQQAKRFRTFFCPTRIPT
jgi:hypothetical protein